MINRRLKWYLENINWFSSSQYGFRQFRSTSDHLNNLHADICEAFANNQYCTIVSLDLEKAYDTVWRHRIIKILLQLGIKGNILHFIKNFLEDRTMQVRIGSDLSEKKKLNNEVPQGSVISVTLFLVAINHLLTELPKPIKIRAFADDITLVCSGNEKTTIKILQQGLNKLTDICNTTGFKFSTSKSEYLVCHKRSNERGDTKLYLGNKELHQSKEIRILGLHIDSKLSWKGHIKKTLVQCTQRINALKALSSINWRASKDILMNTYRAIIRSKLDYGTTIYGSANKSALKCLDSVQSTGVRLAIGAFRSSPVSSILVEGHEPPMDLRRVALELKFTASSTSLINNPIQSGATKMTSTEKKISIHPQLPQPLAYRVKKTKQDQLLYNRIVARRHQHPIPPWEKLCAKVDLHIYEAAFGKEMTSNAIYKSLFNELSEKYRNYKHMYTDGSITMENKGCAVIFEDKEFLYKLPGSFSIFSCEAYAIDRAIDLSQQLNLHRTIIFSDSKSTLDAIKNHNNQNVIIQDIQLKLQKASCHGKQICLAWIPSHQGIAGNEKADTAAKKAAQAGTCDKKAYAFLWALRSRKMEDSYLQIFHELKNIAPHLKPTTISTDFEMSLRKAAKRAFTGALIRKAKKYRILRKAVES
ncbi:uncharacterized protein [Chelonus insularis]|uniref:uncharacterized protein n=1 Tax=Chelonus insularis TaxID=460826 RepID=UPI0015883CA8|nr:uncharacterized protein LOC118069904 [Chelonus insularis]